MIQMGLKINKELTGLKFTSTIGGLYYTNNLSFILGRLVQWRPKYRQNNGNLCVRRLVLRSLVNTHFQEAVRAHFTHSLITRFLSSEVTWIKQRIPGIDSLHSIKKIFIFYWTWMYQFWDYGILSFANLFN